MVCFSALSALALRPACEGPCQAAAAVRSATTVVQCVGKSNLQASAVAGNQRKVRASSRA